MLQIVNSKNIINNVLEQIISKLLVRRRLFCEVCIFYFNNMEIVKQILQSLFYEVFESDFSFICRNQITIFVSFIVKLTKTAIYIWVRSTIISCLCKKQQYVFFLQYLLPGKIPTIHLTSCLFTKKQVVLYSFLVQHYQKQRFFQLTILRLQYIYNTQFISNELLLFYKRNVNYFSLLFGLFIFWQYCFFCAVFYFFICTLSNLCSIIFYFYQQIQTLQLRNLQLFLIACSAISEVVQQYNLAILKRYVWREKNCSKKYFSILNYAQKLRVLQLFWIDTLPELQFIIVCFYKMYFLLQSMNQCCSQGRIQGVH
eukprot:TRINITY_DN7551_c0_g1_i7.p1 TRINITY_DN7551_c0_g1~~TRINITY_DN7551_c0_g1_i7.p1  ORF type:complete len:313 (-),score=-15.69 TRINITY_DN7551_c0_g1_i7:361-1299(-)